MINHPTDNNTLQFSLLFKFFLWWRIFYGSAKFVAGLLLLKFSYLNLTTIFYSIMRYEIMEDPNDFLVSFVSPLLEKLSIDTLHFVAGYMMFWGFIDVFLSKSILGGKRWAFPILLIVILFFIIYELYRLSYTHSLILVGVIIIDIIVFYLVWREYKKISV